MMKMLKIIVFFSILPILFGCPLSQNKSVVLSKNNATVNAVVTPTATPSDSNKNETESGDDAESFKPKDWFILQKAEGDIDGDKQDDLIAVFSKDNPETEKSEISDEDGDSPRLLIIALKKPDGKFKRVFSGSKIILCRYCGGMLGNVVPELKIENRKIYIDQNVLATSEVDYYLEIMLKNDKNFVITEGSVKNRERRSGDNEKNSIKTPMPLSDFDINNY